MKILEVKQEQLIIKIETYWNVNLLLLKYEDSEPIIKIETYWNVN